MKSKDLLSLLTRLESTLSDFSFDELNTEEASHLKSSFQTFKDALEGKVYGNNSTTKDNSPKSFEHNTAESGPKNKPRPQATESGLIASVSHEIRTPLNGIIGFTDLLKESRLDKEQLVQVNAIQSASYSLLEIVNELLEYSKLAAGLEQFQQIEFNLFGLIRDVMFLCNTLVTNKNVTLTSDIGQGIPEILIGDPSKLSQVLLNLMGNAIKFVEEGEVHLSIVELQQKDGELLLEFKISDNGIGIAKEKIDTIFDAFKQAEADTYSKYGGTGLGLSIVRQIIENLGGSINVTSNLGIGTTFKFTIPFEKGGQTPEQKTQSEAETEIDGVKSLVGLKILVFEDNLLNQRLIEQRLKVWQCHIHITDNAQYGMNILENNDIDVVLMDLRMPGMSGFEVTELIRSSSSQRISQVPIIALTADYSIRDQEKCNSYGINDYLLKPFSPEELLTKLVASQNRKGNSRVPEFLAQNDEPQNTEEDSLVNLDQMLEDCVRDIDMLEELALLFKQNTTEFLDSTKIHIHNEDIDRLAFSAHKIKAGLAMIKADGLLGIVEEIQNGCGQHPDWQHLEFLYVRFLNDYPEVEKAIDKAIEDLKQS
ncbi:MAG: ATP-binding protein [Aurantibacter sp.]